MTRSQSSPASARPSPHRGARILQSGVALERAKTVLILLHGRGATAEDILALGEEFQLPDTTYLAPQAAGHSWYPNSFLAPLPSNEPWLSSALELIQTIIRQCENAGLAKNRIALVGFSQGACLASEFVARNGHRYGALIAFTGGMLGPPGGSLHHPGTLDNMPILLSSGDPDPHVPWSRVEQTAAEFTLMGADVRLKKYIARPHTVLPEEIETAQALLQSALPAA